MLGDGCAGPHHDADDCNSHSGQHHRQRPPEISDRVVTLDLNFRAQMRISTDSAGVKLRLSTDGAATARHDSSTHQP
jgi:hypothetical protein